MTSPALIRPAAAADAAAMCAVLNPIIEAGGTTANETPWTENDMRGLIAGLGPRDFAFVALLGGAVVGFQYVEAHVDLDEDTGDIATFVAGEAAGSGVGKALAAASFDEARARGWKRLHAYIRADNAGGRAFYNRLGFREDRRDPAVPLRDGTPIDRIATIVDL